MSQVSPRPKSVPAQRMIPITLRLVIVGESGSGKTSFVNRFSEDIFQDRFVATVGVDFKTRFLEVGKYLVTVEIWDTAGQERFRSITNAYYHGSDGIILAYDITRKETFHNIPGWLDQVRQAVGDSVPVILIGLKLDKEDFRVVDRGEAIAFAEANKLLFTETSAATGLNVSESFHLLCQAILSKKAESTSPPSTPSKSSSRAPIVKVVSSEQPTQRRCLRC